MDTVHDLTGRKFAGSMRVTLRPGHAIRVPGLGDDGHVEGGPHVLPIRIALDLIHQNLADPVFDEPVTKTDPTAVVNSDPQSQHRDPAVQTSSRRKK